MNNPVCPILGVEITETSTTCYVSPEKSKQFQKQAKNLRYLERKKLLDPQNVPNFGAYLNAAATYDDEQRQGRRARTNEAMQLEQYLQVRRELTPKDKHQMAVENRTVNGVTLPAKCGFSRFSREKPKAQYARYTQLLTQARQSYYSAYLQGTDSAVRQTRQRLIKLGIPASQVPVR